MIKDVSLTFEFGNRTVVILRAGIAINIVYDHTAFLYGPKGASAMA